MAYRNTADLITAINAGFEPRFLFFWGHRADRDGLGPGCLSQWWPATFEAEGEQFATAEHYMMAAKARLFADESMRLQILRAETPGKAKALGRKVRPFDDTVWKARCLELVTAGNVAKFSTEPYRRFLLSTGDKILVEASPRDRIWGIGMGAKNENAPHPSRWRGQNLLGFALMAAREQLRTSR